MSKVNVRVGEREYRHPLEGGEFHIFPPGWVGDVDEDVADAMIAADAAEDITVHPLAPPPAPDAPPAPEKRKRKKGDGRKTAQASEDEGDGGEGDAGGGSSLL